MATKEIVAEVRLMEAAADKRIRFLASSLDAFFQEFLEKAREGDRLGTMVAAARIAQLGTAIGEEYEANTNALCDSPTESRVADQAAKLVLDMVNRNADECRALMGKTVEAEAVPDTDKIPDRSLS